MRKNFSWQARASSVAIGLWPVKRGWLCVGRPRGPWIHIKDARTAAGRLFHARSIATGKIIGRAHNQVELLKDATAHAEMLALTQAEAAVGDWRLMDCDLYVTKEPCAMCAGAIVHTRIRRVIFGCTDPSAGAAGSMMNLLQMPTFNHRCEITSGVLQKECAAILQDFFRKRRDEQGSTTP